MGPSPNWIRSGKLIFLSGFEGGGFVNYLPECPGCEPLTRSSSPCPQLRGWPLCRGTMRSCRGRGSTGSWQRHRQRRDCEEARGASMHAAPRTSLLLSQALQALPLGHPHRVSEDDKWVRGLLLWLREAPVQALISGSPHAANGQSAHQPAQQQQQQQPTVGVSRIQK